MRDMPEGLVGAIVFQDKVGNAQSNNLESLIMDYSDGIFYF